MAGKDSHAESAERQPPDYLRAAAEEFLRATWSCPTRWPQDEPAQTALKHLGPLPFPRGPVPLMGILASLYEHVSAAAADYLAGASAPAERSWK
ncbi:MAG: hypothetical protein HBSAPP02_18160 [Phycisphaerae bacterium]|nr:MAG: hypothetical protein HRU71_02290 [Planctomycetia bacterium]RIK70017.1 MAG: hypothetical protein DCC66_06500 [Planctomycetota bacterium]GJQ26784.1 MAG: hypothetical protein HBSAPP02_18160 [Phycisphaerae bacterium]